MNIGIITLHSNTNFGGGLQQIALFETLKRLGHHPEFVCVINDTPMSKFRRILGVFCLYNLVDVVKEWISRKSVKNVIHPANTDLYRRCDDFNYQNLNYTPKFGMKEFPSCCQRYDAMIVGSDQVWTDVCSAVSPFFLDGVGDFAGRRISYAACSAHSHAPFFNRSHISHSLSKFHAVSVRDAVTSLFVESVNHTKPEIVADPTLLYDFEKYLGPSKIKEPYIFAYVLGDKSSEWHARNIAHIRSKVGNIKVIALTTELDMDYPWADEILTGELAVDWMNLLRGADFVYTNSFHAVIFSLKFHKEFIAYYGDLVRSSRLVGLLRQFDLGSRIVVQPAAVNLDIPVHYPPIDEKIAQLKRHSLEWLKNSLVSNGDEN